MSPSEIFDQAQYLSKTSSSDGTGDIPGLLRILNDYYRRQVVAFANTNQNKFGLKSDTSLNIVANQESYRLPTDCLKIKRVEVTYDGTNWRKITVEDSSKVQDYALDATTINQNYQQVSPRADIFGDAIYLRPIPTSGVSLGLRLWYIQSPTLLTTSVMSNASILITPPEFHGYLAYGVAAEIATRQGEDTFAASMIQRWENSLVKIAELYPPLVLDEVVDFFPDGNDYG